MNTTTKRYRLLKDLPTAKAGTIYYKGHGGRYYAEDKVVAGEHDYVVETAHDWFEEVRDAPKFKVEWIGYNDCNFDGYISKFRHSTKFDMELFTKISKAIEDIVNGVEAPDIDQLQRQAFEAARYSIAHPLMPFTHHLEFNTYEDYKNSKK